METTVKCMPQKEVAVMMRKNFEPIFKAKVALEALRGEKTIAQISSEYGVHSTQIGQWKQETCPALSRTFQQVRPPGGQTTAGTSRQVTPGDREIDGRERLA